MTNKTLFWSFYVSFCTFYASLRLKRTVFTRLKIKVRPKGIHSFAFYILICNFPPNMPLMSMSASTYVHKMYLYSCKETFTDVKKTLQIKLFMQNKAKFQKVKLNVNEVLTRDYDQLDTWSIRTKQSQTNPNKAKLKKAEMNVTSIITVGYENKPPIRAPKKQSQTSKRQKPMQPLLLQRIMKITALSASKKQTQTNPTCRVVASGEDGNKPNFRAKKTRRKDGQAKRWAGNQDAGYQMSKCSGEKRWEKFVVK